MILVLALAFILSRSVRTTKGMEATSTLLSLASFILSNVIFLLLNGAFYFKPLGPFENWFSMWLFAFVPVSLAIAFVIFSMSKHVHESR